ncbi:hypothetical protein AJ87_14350 [Rhizobium yanglingense]|nr:hypothetical protein AJ87_14350 [Rhizobium yanglingense]
MLPRKQRCRYDHSDLNTVHRRDEGGAQRNFRLAEPDVATDEAIHRAPGAKVAAHGLDGIVLIFRLIVGEAGRKLVVKPFLCRQRRRVAGQTLGRNSDQRIRHVEQALLEFRLAHLPCAAAEPVQLGFGPLTAIT